MNQTPYGGCKRKDIVHDTGISLSKVKRIISSLDIVRKGSKKQGVIT